MATSILINGLPGRQIDVTDRGLAYGHGLFETLTLDQDFVVAWDLHIQRLLAGAKRLKIPLDADFQELLAGDLKRLLSMQSGPQARQVLKVIVTRGCGGRGYAVNEDIAVNRILMLSPYPAYPGKPSEQGIDTILCETQLARNPLLAGIKHLNRLEQVMARTEWDTPDIREGLVCDTEGNLIEGTMSNIFWVSGGVLYTPALDNCGVNGIVRQRIFEIARAEKLKLIEGEFTCSSIEQCDELFVCNSVIGLWPVLSCKLNEKQTLNWSIGPVSRILQQHLAAEGIF